jgi:hypothetical protein
MSSKNALICRSCGQQVQSGKNTRGSLGLALGLWLGALIAFPLILPASVVLGVAALVYSLWRMGSASRLKTCPACHREGTLIPSDTPEGVRVAASYTTPPIVKR